MHIAIGYLLVCVSLIGVYKALGLFVDERSVLASALAIPSVAVMWFGVAMILHGAILFQ